ncbi:hypothetical protein VZT92_000948 [Zoarces viviparus]|uniref:Uncharacterized protein n=1 Tax=Zoarces viviparus TaxID=48416 RepID=A0AAW1G8P1_ZOAVI
MHAAWQLERPGRDSQPWPGFTALTPSHPSSACEPPTTTTTTTTRPCPAPEPTRQMCPGHSSGPALAQLWPCSGPAAHYVKGPGAPCHSVHLPSYRAESRIREERDTNTRHTRS